MPALKGKSLAVLLIVLALIVGLVATLALLRQQQDSRSKAAASTVLSFNPSSTLSSPIEKHINETTTFDVMLEPGANVVSFVQLEINYDPKKLGVAADTPIFQQNLDALPTTVEGPFHSSGKVTVSMSIGNDVSKAISAPVKLGTLTFTTLEATTTPSQVSFGTLTKILSLASGDQASENVLSSTSPAFISVGDNMESPRLTSIPTSSEGAQASITLRLHGIGSSGDNINPNNSSLSNKNPLHTQRSVNVLLYDNNNVLIRSATGTVNYNTTSGNFTGVIDLGTEITEGPYTLKVKTDQYLRKLAQGLITITPGQTVVVNPMTLVGGDSNNDNALNILDLNILRDCFSDLSPAPSCTADQKLAADLNDDGSVDQTDYNFFLRELPAQTGE